MPDHHQRADARRNYARILTVAEAEVATHGANASLEQIARTAGVGSATVRRHFPTRHALLEAVSRQRIEALCTRARALASEKDSSKDSSKALRTWLDEVVTYCVTARGLATALAYESAAPDSVHENSCSAALEQAAEPLLHRAQQDGTAAAGTTVADLITLIVGITLATEHTPDPATRAHRLFHLAFTGVQVSRRPQASPSS